MTALPVYTVAPEGVRTHTVYYWTLRNPNGTTVVFAVSHMGILELYKNTAVRWACKWVQASSMSWDTALAEAVSRTNISHTIGYKLAEDVRSFTVDAAAFELLMLQGRGESVLPEKQADEVWSLMDQVTNR